MRLALLAGIDNYPKAPLNGCVSDAQAIAHLLSRNEDGSSNFSCLLLTNTVTKAGLRERIADLFSKASECAIFYFSGLGNANGCLLTPDSISADDGISFSEIITLANYSKCRNAVIILDTIYSGATGSPYTFNEGSNKLIIREGVSILNNQNYMPKPIETGQGNIFSTLLCHALDGGAADILGRVNLTSIVTFISNTLGPWDLPPLFKTNSTHIVSVRQCKPHIKPQVLRQLTVFFPDPSMEYPLDPSFEWTSPSVVSDNVSAFRILQQYESVGLVHPIGEEHMYWAAVNSKACGLTSTGKLYWKLIKDGKI